MVVAAARRSGDTTPDAVYYTRGTKQKVLEMTEDQIMTAGEIYGHVMGALDAHLKARLNVEEIYIGICITFD